MRVKVWHLKLFESGCRIGGTPPSPGGGGSRAKLAGWGEPLRKKDHPTPPAFASLRRSTLPLQGRVTAPTTAAASHPELHGAVVARREVAVARHGPEREVAAIAVIAQIEHPRETGRGVKLL